MIKKFLFRLWYRRKKKDPHPWDVSKHQLFPLGTKIIHEGREYRYYKA